MLKSTTTYSEFITYNFIVSRLINQYYTKNEIKSLTMFEINQYIFVNKPNKSNIFLISWAKEINKDKIYGDAFIEYNYSESKFNIINSENNCLIDDTINYDELVQLFHGTTSSDRTEKITLLDNRYILIENIYYKVTLTNEFLSKFYRNNMAYQNYTNFILISDKGLNICKKIDIGGKTHLINKPYNTDESVLITDQFNEFLKFLKPPSDLNSFINTLIEFPYHDRIMPFTELSVKEKEDLVKNRKQDLFKITNELISTRYFFNCFNLIIDKDNMNSILESSYFITYKNENNNVNIGVIISINNNNTISVAPIAHRDNKIALNPVREINIDNVYRHFDQVFNFKWEPTDVIPLYTEILFTRTLVFKNKYDPKKKNYIEFIITNTSPELTKISLIVGFENKERKANFIYDIEINNSNNTIKNIVYNGIKIQEISLPFIYYDNNKIIIELIQLMQLQGKFILFPIIIPETPPKSTTPSSTTPKSGSKTGSTTVSTKTTTVINPYKGNKNELFDFYPSRPLLIYQPYGKKTSVIYITMNKLEYIIRVNGTNQQYADSSINNIWSINFLNSNYDITYFENNKGDFTAKTKYFNIPNAEFNIDWKIIDGPSNIKDKGKEYIQFEILINENYTNNVIIKKDGYNYTLYYDFQKASSDLFYIKSLILTKEKS